MKVQRCHEQQQCVAARGLLYGDSVPYSESVECEKGWTRHEGGSKGKSPRLRDTSSFEQNTSSGAVIGPFMPSFGTCMLG